MTKDIPYNIQYNFYENANVHSINKVKKNHMGEKITPLSGQASDTFKITFEMSNLKRSPSTIVTNDTCPACQVSLIEPF